MLPPELRRRVLDANLELQRQGLVLYTFGNASGVDREKSLIAIKPSGVPYESMKAEDLVITDLDGKICVGIRRIPRLDLATHAFLYRSFPSIGGVAAYSLGICNIVGAGAEGNSVLRHHACGLLQRRGTGDRTAHGSRD